MADEAWQASYEYKIPRDSRLWTVRRVQVIEGQRDTKKEWNESSPLGKGEFGAYQFKHYKEHLVCNKRPSSAPAIARNAKDNGSDRSEHEHKGDTPGYVGWRFAKIFCQIANSERNGEKVE